MISSSLKVFVFFKATHFVCRLAWKWSGTGLLELFACVGWDFFFLFHMCIVSLNMVEIIFFSPPPFFFLQKSQLFILSSTRVNFGLLILSRGLSSGVVYV